MSQTGLASGSSGTALLAIDGDPYRLNLTTDAELPVEFTYDLPAPTTFSRFGVPAVIEQAGNVTFVRSVTVSGSSEGPDTGYQVLAELELETHDTDEEVTEVVPDAMVPVRWIRVRLDGGINIEPGGEGRTVIWFSELIGNGTQEPTELSSAFDGTWDLRLTERLDLRGTPLQLQQDGTTITGCYGEYRLAGTVNSKIARATGEDDRGGPAALIMVADDDATIHASVSTNNGRFGARTNVVDPDLGETACAAQPPDPVVCGTDVYVNFNYDSAVIRPESDAGMGESQPLIAPDANESAREINRRVEITCG